MKDLEQLVRYLDGDLNDQEKQQLIDKLKVDPSMSEKINLIKDIDSVIGDKCLSEFEESVVEVENAFFNRKPLEKNVVTPKAKRINVMRIAAVIAIMIASTFGYFLIKEQFSFSNEKLFASYYEKMPANFVTRSNEIKNDDFSKAIKQYNQNKYAEAIIEFDKVIKNDPNNNAAKLFLGICYTETNQYKSAASLFTNIIQLKDPIFEEHASWYLSLCYLKTNNSQLARNILNNLVNSDSFYMEKASELLKQMR